MNILEKINNFNNILDEKGKWGEVTHPGVLEVPEGKDVETLPLSHFMKLAEKAGGTGPIVRALMNLYRWNKNRDPKLSKWAKNMQEKLSKEFPKKWPYNK